MEGWVLCTANALGLPFWGQATERVNSACYSQRACGFECFRGEVALWLRYYFVTYTQLRSLYWFYIIKEKSLAI